MNIYSTSTPQNTFYVEGKIFVGKNCCILKLGGIYSDKYSGSDTVCTIITLALPHSKIL